jgi:Lrp/AsnC family leucine-responsive transcriptional regulator
MTSIRHVLAAFREDIRLAGARQRISNAWGRLLQTIRLDGRAAGRDLDRVDRQILAILQENARTPNAEIARRVGVAPSAIFARVRKLEDAGYVGGYEARLAAGRLGLGLVAFVAVRSDEQPGGIETARLLAEIPEVQEVHHVAGEDCYLLKVRAADNGALAQLLRERFAAIPSVRATRTTIVLETIKETARLPIPEPARPANLTPRPRGARAQRARGAGRPGSRASAMHHSRRPRG